MRTIPETADHYRAKERRNLVALAVFYSQMDRSHVVTDEVLRAIHDKIALIDELTKISEEYGLVDH